MCPVRDANLDVSPTASDLPLIVTNVLGTEVDLESTPVNGLCVRVNIGYTVGNSAKLTGTLNIIAHAASSSGVASSDPIVGQLDDVITMSNETAGYTLEDIFPITLKLNQRFVRLEYALATNAASDSPSWSKVEAYITEQVGMNWTREINFH